MQWLFKVWKPRNANTKVTKEGEKAKECIQDNLDKLRIIRYGTNKIKKDSYILVEEIKFHG